MRARRHPSEFAARAHMTRQALSYLLRQVEADCARELGEQDFATLRERLVRLNAIADIDRPAAGEPPA